MSSSQANSNRRTEPRTEPGVSREAPPLKSIQLQFIYISFPNVNIATPQLKSKSIYCLQKLAAYRTKTLIFSILTLNKVSIS